MSGESRSIVNRLTKPAPNDHSCRNLARTDANPSGVDATEISPYKVTDDKILHARVSLGLVIVVGSSFGREPVAPSPGTGGPSDTL